jgi:hypothetical protein
MCTSAHHIEPRSEGGGNEADNLVTLCGLCRVRHKPHYAACGFMPHTPYRGRGSLDNRGALEAGIQLYAA